MSTLYVALENLTRQRRRQLLAGDFEGCRTAGDRAFVDELQCRLLVIMRRLRGRFVRRSSFYSGATIRNTKTSCAHERPARHVSSEKHHVAEW